MMRTWLLRILRAALAGLLLGGLAGGLEVDLLLRTEVTELLTAVQRVQLWALGTGTGAALGMVLGVLSGSLFGALLGHDDETKSQAFYTGRDPLRPWLPLTAAFVALGLWMVQLVPRLAGSGGMLHGTSQKAAALLAVGLSVVGLGQVLRRAGGRFDTISRGLPILVLGPIALMGITLSLAVSAPMAPPGSEDEPKKGQHDVILITVDGLRADHIGPAPHLRSPNLEWMAALGMHFQQVAAPSVAEAPPVAAVLTGRHPLSLPYLADEQRLPDNAGPTLAELFQAAGWSTGAFVGSAGLDGMATGLSRGFATYDDAITDSIRGARRLALVRFSEWFRWGTRGAPGLKEVLRQGPATVKRFWEWQTWHTGERYFAWIHLSDPRNPGIGYDAPPETLVDPIPGEEGRSYAERVVATDAVIGKILESLDKDGKRDDTIIAVLGTRGYVPGGGRPTVADTWAHVPLFLFGGATPTARRVEVPVRSIDLPRTLLDLAGAGSVEVGESRGLLVYAEDVPAPGRETVVVGRPNAEGLAAVALRSGAWKLVRTAADNQALYLLDRDPTELHDATGERPEEVARASAALTEALGRPLPRALRPAVDFGRAARLRALQ